MKHSQYFNRSVHGGVFVRHRANWIALVCLASFPCAASAQVAGQLASNKNPPTSAPEDDGTSKIVATDLICVVNGEHVLAGDVFAYIDNIIEENRKSVPKGQEDAIRRALLRRMLAQYVQIKAQYQAFLSEMIGNATPTDAKEKRRHVEVKANQLFYEKQVPNLMKSNNVSDIRSLEEKLRERSSSLTQLRQKFMENILASESERKHVPEDIEVLRDELIEYYNDHADQWQKPARARWRQLTARFDRFPSRVEARQAIEAMGNEVYLGGKPFGSVAKASSQGFTASEGGVQDWTTKGALKSAPLDAAIFSIEPKRLSQIIEDDFGYHIIEVIEREDAKVVSFEAAHDEMRDAIVSKKRKKLAEEYRKKVMDHTVIWTLWPEDIPGSRSLREVNGQ